MTDSIDRALAAHLHRVPGMVALATTATGTLHEGAYGVADPATGREMAMDAVFWWASMTKALVSTAAMGLVEQGRLSLDAPISEVLPRLANPLVLDGSDAAGTPRLRAAARPPSLRELLTHTSGYAYNTWNAPIEAYLRGRRTPRIPTDWDQAEAMPLVFEPGTGWAYGISTDVVGWAVEAVSGMPLDAYLQQAVFAPLGMADATVTLSEAQRARLVPMLGRNDNGTLAPIAWPIGGGRSFAMGGGALCGTGGDYLRFLRMVLAGGGNVLTRASIAEMGRNQIGGLSMEPMRVAVPGRSRDFEPFPGMRKGWGLGFMMTTEDVPERRSAGSLAWAGLANTYYWIDPKRGVAGVFLTQILPFGDEAALEAFADFERAVYRQIGAA